MAAVEQQTGLSEAGASQRRGLWSRRWRWRISLALLLVIGLTAIGAWLTRERIVDSIISDQLAAYDIDATYEIVSIDPQRQVIANLVIGDPGAPDFIVKRVVINLDYGFGAPSIEGLELIAPRLFGTYRDGRLSFGGLDSVIFADSEEPPSLPALDLAIVDGRALIEGDFGALAAKIDGSGPLNDGFEGKLAATAPNLAIEGCFAKTVTLFGDLTTNDGSTAFDGPIRLRDVECGGAVLESADLGANLALTDDFAGLGGTLALAAGGLSYDGNRAEVFSGKVDLSLNESGLNLRHDVTANGVLSPYGSLGELRADGALRSDAGFARSDWTMDISGERMRIADDVSAMLSDARSASGETLIAPLLEKFERNFARAVFGGRMNASMTVRHSDEATTIVIPEGQLIDARGERVVAVSRLAWADNESGTRLVGNFVTGGTGLPQVNGRMEQEPGGRLALRAAMAEYSEGGDRLAIPRLQIVQGKGGDFSFTGLVMASGALPNGRVTGLRLPVEGSWSASNGLAVGRRCIKVGFDSLALSELVLEGHGVALCPEQGGAMVRYDGDVRIGIETRDLALDAQLAGSPTRIAARAASFDYPGNFVLNDLNATIGADGSAVRLSAAHFVGAVDEEIGGTFTGGTAQLDIVPLDLTEMAGRWAYRDATLIVDQGAFLLTERVDGVEVARARFEPLIATDATLTLAENDITAQADLLQPATLRLVTSVDVAHDLDSGLGWAAINVPGLVLDDRLRPQDLTYLTQGVIAFANGTITGTGDVRWTSDTITSTGTFATENLDLAAAFGPIDGLRGTIEFTDLINLTTAPGQVLEIGSINPGVEVLAGRVRYSMTNGEVITLEDARWPFMGGELILRPVEIVYGKPGSQRYVFEMIALDAATFVSQMELDNLGAQGTFDGTVPIAFDDMGNGTIEDGLLISRQPGGNVSYVGELTYEDMGEMANFAFQSLRSLDYNQMSIGLSGELAGEIVTNFQIDGVRQGEGASRNIVTRQLAKLPIRFNINVRSESFYQLATILRGIYDPSAFGNPVDRGLLRVEDGRLAPDSPFTEPNSEQRIPNPENSAAAEVRKDDELPVQPPESDTTP